MKKIFLLGIITVIALGVFASQLSLTQQQPTAVHTYAETCHANCITEPPCCAQIIAKMNQLGGPSALAGLDDSDQPYHECPWTEDNADTNLRAFCHLSTCNKLPSGIQYRGHCGWYWTYHDPYTKTGYGCVIGPDDAHLTPICGGGQPTSTPGPTGGGPTSTPRPTRTPTPGPQATLTPYPTEIPQATPTTPPAQPTATTGLTQPTPPLWPTAELWPTNTPPPAQLEAQAPAQPFINPLPTIANSVSKTTNQVVETANHELPRSLDILGFFFKRIVYYDKLLEYTIDQKTGSLFKKGQ